MYRSGSKPIKNDKTVVKTRGSLSFIIAAATLLAVSGCSKPKVNEFSAPEKTNWKPVGVRMAGNTDHSVIPSPITHKTMHGNINNTDNLWVATAPMFELDWVAEETMYAPDGPTIDQHGNAYFSPLNPQEDVSLIALDGQTGTRRWAIPGEGIGNNFGTGAPLILSDPDNANEEIIYQATYESAMAISTDGEILWKTPTGLTEAMHTWGMNYHPQTDSVLGLSIEGHLFAMDRQTGESRDVLLELPGAPAAASDERPPAFVMNMGDKITNEVFGQRPDGVGFFTAILDSVMGGGYKVANFFGVDPNTGKIYVAATAPDHIDGKIDGVSGFGALYLLNLSEVGGTYSLTVEKELYFDGGTASTPTISADSSRVVVSDNEGNVIVLDADLNELWRLDVGEQLAASVAVSADNHEFYAVGRRNVFKIIDHETYGELAWTANLEAWSTKLEFNALNPTITANGVVVSIGAGYIPSQQLMLAVGMGLLDRETGELRYFAEGREDSISVSVVAPDGGILTANSPLRRVIGRAVFPNLTPPIIGGVSRYRPIRNDLLLRDSSCAAMDRLINMQTWFQDHQSAAFDDFSQVATLISQAIGALEKALDEGDLASSNRDALDAALASSSIAVRERNMDEAIENISTVCSFFE